MNSSLTSVTFRERSLFLVFIWLLVAVLYQWCAEFYVEAGDEFRARSEAFIKAPLLAAVSLAFTLSHPPALVPSSWLISAFVGLIVILSIALLSSSRRLWFTVFAAAHLLLLGASIFSVQSYTHYAATHGHG